MTQILKRLEIIKSSIAIEEIEIIELQIAKLQSLSIDDDVLYIIQSLEDGAYATAGTLIQNYLSKFSGVVAYVDGEIQGLKLELKSLESKLQELVEQKTEYLNDIEEFNREYNLRLGDVIRVILNLSKEILYKKTIKQQKLKVKYQEDIQTFHESKETIDELKDTIAELEDALESIDENDENYDELSHAYNELKEELEKLEDELELQEEELELAKEFIEDESIEEEFEEAKAHYDEFEGTYEHIKEAQKDSIKLSEDEKTELKKLYRKAARLCHPDIMPDELKEKAHALIQQLNAAYSKSNLAQVKKILHALENGSGFEASSQSINDKELIKEKIKEYKENIANLEKEIEDIKVDEIFEIISELDDWDEYFEELKNQLLEEQKKLEEQARVVLVDKDISENKNIFGFSKEEPKEEKAKNISSDNHKNENELIDKIKNDIIDDFQKQYGIDISTNAQSLTRILDEARKVANELMTNEKVIFTLRYITYLNNKPIHINKVYFKNWFGTKNEPIVAKTSSSNTAKKAKPVTIQKEFTPYAEHIQSIQNNNFEKIRRYCNNLADENRADAMQRYLAENGKMHKALIYDTLEQFIAQLNGKTITLIDWGCNQGIASMLVLDYIREKQLDIEVAFVLLIEEVPKALSRAMAQVAALAGDSVKIVAIKSDDEAFFDVMKTNTASATLNLFANDAMPIDFLDIDYDIFQEAYFVCVSNSDREFVDDIYENFSDFIDIQNLSNRNGQIGRFQRFERIFAL